MIRTIAFFCAAACAFPVAAQPYPAKPVRILATSTAGGPLDVFTRLVANKMEERLKQPMVVESRPGAGGNIAVSAALAAPADGYTVLSSVDTTFTVNPSLFKQIPFDPEKDFIAVSALAKFGQIIAVHPDLPVKSLKELVALSKQRDLNYSSAGNGFPSHLSMAYLQAVTGLRARHIPFKGNPPALLALMNNDVQAIMAISTSLLPHVKAGRMRMLAYSDTTRSEVVPNIPTVAEEGFKDFEVVFTYVMLVKAGTPQPIIDALYEASTQAVMSPEVRDKLKGVDTVPIAMSSADSAAWLRNARKKWSEVVTQMHVKVD
jgi:tripartite-type tricarboxylate transporter receptor subunit TctC